MKHYISFVACCALTAVSGCASLQNLLSDTHVDAIATSVQKPANIALYLEVSEGDEPVTELELKNFTIYEDGQALSPDEIGLRLLPREPVSNERVVVLVDMGANPTAEMKEATARAVENFVERVRPELPVTVLAYDGTPGLRLVGDYPRAAEGAPAASADGLRRLRPGDASRDLHGALIKGVRELDVRLMSQKKPVRVGTLVVFARGADLAGRTDQLQVLQALEGKHYNVIGIGIGADTPYLEAVTNAGVIHAQSPETLPIAFEDAGARVALTHRKYYVLAYCSPARSGTRALRVELEYTSEDNDEKGGSYSYEFDATGFGPGCNPDATPRFVVPRPANEAAPPARAETDPSQATSREGPLDDSGSGVAPPPDKPEYQ